MGDPALGEGNETGCRDANLYDAQGLLALVAVP